MVSFENLWEIMKEHNMTKTQLRKTAKLSSSTFSKLVHNQQVSLDVLVRLCVVLNCQISDICVVINEQSEEVEQYE